MKGSKGPVEFYGYMIAAFALGLAAGIQLCRHYFLDEPGRFPFALISIGHFASISGALIVVVIEGVKGVKRAYKEHREMKAGDSLEKQEP